MIKLTTTQTVTINDLGKITFTHPVVDYVLTDMFTPEQIRDSVDTQAAVTAGHIVLTDDNNTVIADVKDQPTIVINVDGTLASNSDTIIPSQKAIKTYADTKVPNTRTVNSKALSANVTLTTADIADSTDKRYCTDAQKTVIGNTSGTNSGNETTTTIGTLINGATAKNPPIDADMIGLMDSIDNTLKKLSWVDIKATLKTYFDGLYSVVTTKGDLFSYSTAATRLGVGTAGQDLTPNTAEATGLKWVSPVFVNTNPVDPSTTSSTTGVMMGLAVAFTPTKSGKILMIVSGDVDNATNNRGSTFQMRYGTGTAPINGAALTGTTAGGLKNFFQNNASVRVPFSLNSAPTLTVGTTYWLDISLASVTGGTSRVRNLTVSIIEQ